jgi:hypothetical protein
MKNIKGFAIANDVVMKRIAITYDEINDDGSIINANVKMNRIITDKTVLKAVESVTNYAQTVIDAEE